MSQRLKRQSCWLKLLQKYWLRQRYLTIMPLLPPQIPQPHMQRLSVCLCMGSLSKLSGKATPFFIEHVHFERKGWPTCACKAEAGFQEASVPYGRIPMIPDSCIQERPASKDHLRFGLMYKAPFLRTLPCSQKTCQMNAASRFSVIDDVRPLLPLDANTTTGMPYVDIQG